MLSVSHRISVLVVAPDESTEKRMLYEPEKWFVLYRLTARHPVSELSTKCTIIFLILHPSGNETGACRNPLFIVFFL